MGFRVYTIFDCYFLYQWYYFLYKTFADLDIIHAVFYIVHAGIANFSPISDKFAWHESCSYWLKYTQKLDGYKKMLYLIFIFAIIYFGIRKILYRWFGESDSLPNRGTAKRRLPVRV